ncbi:ABC transporter permease [Bacillus andreraoultii]|uniref:ABC transporter permease n=1 Tax=Bacillus andreraoultii TaxID=1499685 RepID=UPI00053AAE59|nr:ABC transporter permease [Bacillus andreraoultii]
MNSKKLWSSRFQERLKEMLRYGRYMFNDHLLIVLLFALGGGAFYYKDWVATLDETFPTAVIFAIIFSLLLSNGNVITFLKEPDKVFLLPVETEMKSYFIRSYFLSVMWRLYSTFLIFLLVIPIYLQTMGTNAKLLHFSLLLIGLQAVNLFTRWMITYDLDQESVIWDVLIRHLLNGVIVFFFISGRFSLFFIIFGLFVLYTLYFHVKLKKRGIPWERLIDYEERRMAFFYRIANLFTDVPQLRNRVKRRKWADMFMRTGNVQQNQTYAFLFVRSFFRSGDYFGLFMRLTIIAALFIWGLDGSYVAFAIALLFIYLTGFQLISLWKHYDAVIWTELYPVNEEAKKQSFLKLMLNVLWTQNLIFVLSFITSLDFQKGLLLFIVLTLFCYLFVFVYCKRQIEKWNELT